jgi:hypothetical protein
MRWIPAYILSSRLIAVAITGVCGALSLFVFLMPLAAVSAATVALVALRKGVLEGLWVVGWAALLCWVTALLGGGILAFTPAMFLWLPVLAAAWVLRRTHSHGALLMAAGVMGMIFALWLRSLTGDVVEFWSRLLAPYYTQILDSGAQVQTVVPGDLLQQMNGRVSMVFSLCIILTVFLARWWQSLLYHPGGFRAEFLALRLPRRLVFLPALIGILICTLEDPYRPSVLADLLMVLGTLYVIQGLALAHGLVASRGLSSWWMSAIYVLMLMAPPGGVLVLALFGACDSYLNFRRYWTEATQNG